MNVRTLLVGAAAGAILAGAAAATAATQPPPYGNGSTTYPSGLPPYWHKTPPSWCTEDEPCWIGSTADGRSDAASYVAWQQVVRGTYDCLRVATPYYIPTCIKLWAP